ncbi:MAG: 2-C-methyl-D-erythritol 2,4-cyclodiphosphate synthase [Sedimentisphaerales bacterium]|nr:2-C-methyl-D-erythritol 2,4-cyclodiphosphate synthase [Sedimentisphaerales bacterium]
MAAIVRIGQGYDLHRLEVGGPLILCGVSIDFDRHLAGHSDADVVLHAVIDALLGAAGLEDIGSQFPDTDPAYKGIASTELLSRTREKIEKSGYLPANVDLTIITDQPKLGPYKPLMRKRLAELLNLEAEAVGVKAKTNEGLGETGTGKAIICQAVVSLKKKA